MVATFAMVVAGREAAPQREARVQIRVLADNDSGEGLWCPARMTGRAMPGLGAAGWRRPRPTPRSFPLLELRKSLAITVDGALLTRAHAGACTTWRPSGQLLVLDTAARGLP